jgi:hypothetical protein
MLIYLDNCCFNRPFDDQRSWRVRLEAEAKLRIQELMRQGEIAFAWSFMLDFENLANPFRDRREMIVGWKAAASLDLRWAESVVEKAKEFAGRGLGSADALHLACAIAAGCSHFLTTDRRILSKRTLFAETMILDPIQFVKEMDL